jgi:hypothetical protein
MSVPSTPSPTAPSQTETQYAKSVMTTFIAVVCGVTGFCILVAVLLPLVFWWRRKQERRAKGGSVDPEKEPVGGWLPEHAHRASDGGEPLLTTDTRSSTDGSTRTRKPHYRLASENRPLQPVDYVLDLYRPSSHDSDIDDGDDEQKKYLVPRFSPAFPSPLSTSEFFFVQPEYPPDTRHDSSETITNAMVHDDTSMQERTAQGTAMQGRPAQGTTTQVNPAYSKTNLKNAVSRSSTLSTMSVYSQSTIPSPQQDSSSTPSLSAFPLPPPVSAPTELVSPTEMEANAKIQSPNGDVAVINYLVRDRPRIPLRSPQRPTTAGSHMSTIMEPHDEP